MLELIRIALKYLNSLISQIIYKDSFTKIQQELARETLKLENKVMEKHGSGVFIERLSTDASNLSEIFYNLFEYITNVIAF